ncbi:hypothetical protein HMI55_007243 [Coelomomyces lativittatus]|nr:hypothetical protein HMI55_007243 [Coelomomyces lativittatus]
MSLPIFYDTDENMNIAVRHATIKVLDLPRNISVYPKPPPIEDYKNSLQLHRQKIAPPSKSAQIAETFCPKPSYLYGKIQTMCPLCLKLMIYFVIKF